MEEFDFIAEDYQQIVNEGFIDRAVGTAKGIGQSVKNVPSRVSNVTKAAASAYTGNKEGVDKAVDANKQMKTGRQAKIDHVNGAHANKFKAAIEQFSKTLESLQSDYISDAGKVGIPQEMVQQAQVEILNSIATKLGITAEIISANAPTEQPPPLPEKAEKKPYTPLPPAPISVPRNTSTKPTRSSGINTDDE